ncbi:unnamed protein product [Boreogadus saida]
MSGQPRCDAAPDHDGTDFHRMLPELWHPRDFRLSSPGYLGKRRGARVAAVVLHRAPSCGSASFRSENKFIGVGKDPLHDPGGVATQLPPEGSVVPDDPITRHIVAQVSRGPAPLARPLNPSRGDNRMANGPARGVGRGWGAARGTKRRTASLASHNRGEGAAVATLQNCTGPSGGHLAFQATWRLLRWPPEPPCPPRPDWSATVSAPTVMVAPAMSTLAPQRVSRSRPNIA